MVPQTALVQKVKGETPPQQETCQLGKASLAMGRRSASLPGPYDSSNETSGAESMATRSHLWYNIERFRARSMAWNEVTAAGTSYIVSSYGSNACAAPSSFTDNPLHEMALDNATSSTVAVRAAFC